MTLEFDNPLRQNSVEKQILSETDREDRELEKAAEQIWGIAREFELDPYPTVFEIVPSQIMYELGSYGLPEHYSHWTYGRAYRQMKTMYDYGLSKIYEMVVNSNPAQAFLLENNPKVENEFVMAHVLAHADFFKNNHVFSQTRKDMPYGAALQADKIQSYEEQEGKIAVEKLLDAVLAIDEHVDTDPKRIYRLAGGEEIRKWNKEAKEKRFKTKSPDEFADLFEADEQEPPEKKVSFPPKPDKDLLGFIRNYAPELSEWERDVIDMIRSESLYFWPQRRTKIMNEGWASFWHKRIMREMGDRGFITPSEDERWWEVHSGVVSPNSKHLNPYYFGMKMFEYIADYHNGNLKDEEQHWLKEEGIPVLPSFKGDFKESPGFYAVREVMKANDDQSFIRNYFNKITSDRMNLYIYEEKENDGNKYYVVKEKGWKEIRDRLVSGMTNCGMPYVVVTDGDYGKRRELYLEHYYEGIELDVEYIEKTLPYIYHLWKRPVYLETIAGGKKVVFSFDGKNVGQK